MYFLEYSPTYYSLAEDYNSPIVWKKIILDPSKLTSALPFTEKLKRKVIPNYMGSAPTSGDSRWISELTLDFTIEMYDCAVDFTVPVDNNSMLDKTFSGFQNPNFRYVIGSGSYTLNVTVPPQTLQSICGSLVVTCEIDAAYQSFISFNSATNMLTINASTAGVPPFTTGIQFTLKNNWHTAVVPTPANIQLFNCDSSVISNNKSLTLENWPYQISYTSAISQSN